VVENSTNDPVALKLTGGAPTSVAVSAQAMHGAAKAGGTQITYTPTSGYVGADSFQYMASNAGGASAAATASITVNAATPKVIVITASTNWTVPSDWNNANNTIEEIGAGGNGGAGASGAGGGGGGSGGYSRIALAAGLVLGGVNVVIGLGGSVAPLPPPANDYSAGGGATSFGALCVANGGGGGGGNASGLNIWGWPGLGAPVGVGDLALPGNPGGIGTTQNAPAGSYTNVQSGAGGAIWGGGGIQALMGVGGYAPGNPGMGPGAGGSGAVQNEITTPVAQAGGQGANGICVVTEYCWADTIDDGCGCGPTSGQARVAIGGPQGWDND
jgi:hypothetical protein